MSKVFLSAEIPLHLCPTHADDARDPTVDAQLGNADAMARDDTSVVDPALHSAESGSTNDAGVFARVPHCTLV